MKKFFLTLDLEEWYHLEYLKGYTNIIGDGMKYINSIIPFIKKVSSMGIKMTVFVVGDIAIENKNVILEISKLGHEIGCHSYSHSLIYKMNDSDFIRETLKAKEILEDIINKPVVGYRSPCFSMDNHKLELLWNCGFKYDASLIKFKEHKLYNVLDMTEYRKIEDLVYEKEGYLEFEAPTLDLMGKSIPISGGGYFRLIPLVVMKQLLKIYQRSQENFIFYIHPFELSEEPLINLKKSGAKNSFRFQVGRKGNVNRLIEFLEFLKEQDYQFITIDRFISTNDL